MRQRVLEERLVQGGLPGGEGQGLGAQVGGRASASVDSAGWLETLSTALWVARSASPEFPPPAPSRCGFWSSRTNCWRPSGHCCRSRSRPRGAASRASLRPRLLACGSSLRPCSWTGAAWRWSFGTCRTSWKTSRTSTAPQYGLPGSMPWAHVPLSAHPLQILSGSGVRGYSCSVQQLPEGKILINTFPASPLSSLSLGAVSKSLWSCLLTYSQ